MNSIEFTKIAAAVLSALLVIFGTKTAIEMASHGEHEKAGYTLPVAEVDSDAATGDGAPTADAAVDFSTVLATANADAGKKVFAKCKGCHLVEKGKPSTVGPNLWGVVNRAIASSGDFDYSSGLKEKQGEWTFENLAAFLKAPKLFAPGTKMVFAGLKDAATKADLIAYLAAQADTPVALPSADAAPANDAAPEADAAPAAAPSTPENTDKPAE